VTGKPAEEKARAIRSLKAWCYYYYYY